MLNEKIVKCIQDKIANSSEFANSQINKNLLLFLIECYLRNETPKEATIAIKIFKRNDDFNPTEDTIVRVYMHNLRNKLDAYYSAEGKNDKYKLQIPKGHYAVKFIPSGKKRIEKSIPFRTTRNIICLFIVLLLIISLVYLWNQNREMQSDLNSLQVIDRNNAIWKDYLTSDLQNLIVIGNHLFFSEFDTDLDRWQYIRDLQINTHEELEQYKKRFPNKKIDETNEAYFPDGCVWSIPPILKIFNSIPRSIVLRRVKDITPQAVYDNNVIFLGSIKTLGIFERYVSGSHFQYKLIPHRLFRLSDSPADINKVDTHKIIYNPEDGSPIDTLTTSYNQSTGYHRDLALALKFPGPQNNSIFIITSFYSSGVPEVTKFLTNPETLKLLEAKFAEKYHKVPPYFEILFEVRGVIKTGFYLEIKYLNEIDKNVKIW